MTKTKGIRSRIPQIWLDRLIPAVKVVIATGLILFLFTSARLNFALIIDSYKYPAYLFSGALCCTLALLTLIFRKANKKLLRYSKNLINKFVHLTDAEQQRILGEIAMFDHRR
ncbi:MAG: hypothetical protein JRE64_01180 [Deltaproteobacteria bacterium]|nr:hypothetical protein [Deltaproteobacteria bacterium]